MTKGGQKGGRPGFRFCGNDVTRPTKYDSPGNETGPFSFLWQLCESVRGELVEPCRGRPFDRLRTNGFVDNWKTLSSGIGHSFSLQGYESGMDTMDAQKMGACIQEAFAAILCPPS